MTRPVLLAGALALAAASLAHAQPAPTGGDPSNPAGAPLSPSQDAANQPARGDDSEIVRPADPLPDPVPDTAQTPPASGQPARVDDRTAPPPRPRR